MNARVANSAEAIEDWIFHWICLVHNNKNGGGGLEEGGRGTSFGHKHLLSTQKV